MSPAERTYTESRIAQWAGRLDRLPRMTRIVLSLVIALVLTAVVSIAVDQILLDTVYDGGMDAMVPAIVAAAVGIVFYGFGWWAMVGFDGDPNQPWRAGTVSVLFVALGIAGLIVLVMLILVGLAQGYIL